jgi:hypothetical protein
MKLIESYVLIRHLLYFANYEVEFETTYAEKCPEVDCPSQLIPKYILFIFDILFTVYHYVSQ